MNKTVKLIFINIGVLLLLNSCANQPATTVKDTQNINTELNTKEAGTTIVLDQKTKSALNDQQSNANAYIVLNEDELVGHWVSEQPELAGNGHYLVRQIHFEENTFQVEIKMYSDQALKKPIFILKNKGKFAINKNPSMSTKGIYNIDFIVSHQTLQVITSDKLILDDLGFDQCGLVANKENDISFKGCGPYQALKRCKNIYDLIQMQKNSLKLGEPAADGNQCSQELRPEMLGQKLIRKD